MKTFRFDLTSQSAHAAMDGLRASLRGLGQKAQASFDALKPKTLKSSAPDQRSEK